MRLSELIKETQVKAVNGSLDIEVKGIAYDSRKVVPGDIFVAIAGFKQDGTKFIPQAIKSGAVAIVGETPVEADSITQIIVPSCRIALAEISNTFYDHPSRKLKIVGVTGTNGKTSICYLLDHILRSCGRKVGLISTIETKFNGVVNDSLLTTPESLELQKLLAQMVENGITHVVMEVSSHSLALNRVRGTEFDIAVFTNLTHDHLDFHKTMDEYLKAKLKLFSSLGSGSKKTVFGIVNVDDKSSKPILSILKAKALTYSLEKDSNLTAKSIKFNISGMNFDVETGGEKVNIETKLLGNSNAYNILASILCSLSMGEEISSTIKAVNSFKGTPGRYENIVCKQGFNVIVDFAHSPDSLEKLLQIYKPLTKGKVILVFGAPGNRDREKRPIMGKIAAKYADYSIITTDDPHSEEPGKIIKEIEIGARGQGLGTRKVEKIVDRKQAIEKALKSAKKNDVVLIAGRGHEKFQDFNDKKVQIDDREVVREFL